MIMKNLKKKLSLQAPKNKVLENSSKTKHVLEHNQTEINNINNTSTQKSTSDWKREREFLFSKIKALEKEVSSLKSKNQELQIQLTLTQTSIETKQSFTTSTNENLKISKKRKIDHKRIYSEMFTSYRKKKFKQNSEDGRSGIGVLKQIEKQKPKSFGEGTKGIIGNKILSNIIKEFRIDLQETKKQDKFINGDNNNNTINNNKSKINKNGKILNINNIVNNNNNNNKIINKESNKKGNNKFTKNFQNKINNYPNKKLNNNQNTNNNLGFQKKNNTITNNIRDTIYNNANANNINKKKIICEPINNPESTSLADDNNQNITYNQQSKNDLSNDLNGDYYRFFDFSKKGYNEINIENITIDNDDFTEKINESSSGQTHLTGETILKKPNDFNSNINTSNSLSKSKSNSNNNTNINQAPPPGVPGGEVGIANLSNFNTNNLKNTPPSSISQSSSVIFQPLSKNLDGFSSANSLSPKRSGGRSGPIAVLKFHLDAVRGIYIDPYQKVITSVSEDKTIALWDIEKIIKYSKIEEPFLVFRIHTTPIFSISGPSNKALIGDYLNNVSVYSSGSDGVIRGIQIPDINTPNTEENLNKYTLLSWRVHQDMIWQLNYHPSNFLLSSVSSDGTVKIFKTYELYEDKNNINFYDEKSRKKFKKNKTNFQHYYPYDNSYSKNLVRNLIFRNRHDNIIEIPTSCDWRPEISSQIIVSHIAPYIRLYDIETGKYLNDFTFEVERGLQYESKQVNKIIFLNNDIFVTGHEDKHIKLFDVRSGKLINDFVGHTDSLNDLCKGFNENQILTCSQDGSVRGWDVRGGKNKLNFDIPAHRKKYDEGCFGIKTLVYRGENYFVTCGADACVKIFAA